MSCLLPDLDWQPVLLVKATREPFTGTYCGLQASRLYLALHPDGVICVAWDIPLEQRIYPHVRLVGWKPLRDVPFVLPVRFARKGDLRVSALIPNGTWILPYDAEQYHLYQRLQSTWEGLMSLIDSAPHSSYTLDPVRNLVAPTIFSPNRN
ncbi:MAG: hypothetical protein K8I60_14600 [Anaerolineae bacterium]|nr:hypothetical protein [Anaerolineae bacterium]